MAGGRLWTLEEETAVRAMTRGPAEITRVARELGRTRAAIYARRNLLGLGIPDRWTDEEKAKLDRLVVGGLTVQEAADRMEGRTRPAAYARRHRARARGAPMAVASYGGRDY